jgi:lipoprotein NlpD
MRSWVIILFFALFVTACNNEAYYAPVVSVATVPVKTMAANPAPVAAAPADNAPPVVSIEELIAAIDAPVSNEQHNGPGSQQAVAKQAASNAIITQQPVIAQSSGKPAAKLLVKSTAKVKGTYATVSHWLWPAKGKVIDTYSTANKGINITGNRGAPIYAAAAGKVVYAGDGLRGYGNLIIIKHNSSYLSAYAHNQAIAVQEGDWVKQGQNIATMGSTNAGKVMLHFEIRRAGKPVNPMTLLDG